MRGNVAEKNTDESLRKSQSCAFLYIYTGSGFCVSLCICLPRGHVYKKSLTRCHTHTQTHERRLNRSKSDLPRLPGSQSTCRHASSSHPRRTPSLPLLFHLHLYISQHPANLLLPLPLKASARMLLGASWEGSRWGFGPAARDIYGSSGRNPNIYSSMKKIRTGFMQKWQEKEVGDSLNASFISITLAYVCASFCKAAEWSFLTDE